MPVINALLLLALHSPKDISIHWLNKSRPNSTLQILQPLYIQELLFPVNRCSEKNVQSYVLNQHYKMSLDQKNYRGTWSFRSICAGDGTARHCFYFNEVEFVSQEACEKGVINQDTVKAIRMSVQIESDKSHYPPIGDIGFYMEWVPSQQEMTIYEIVPIGDFRYRLEPRAQGLIRSWY